MASSPEITDLFNKSDIRPTLQAAISALGLQEQAARRFGSQGEGAIAGRWVEYSVGSLEAHDRFRFSRLVCAAAG